MLKIFLAKVSAGRHMYLPTMSIGELVYPKLQAQNGVRTSANLFCKYCENLGEMS